MTRDERLQRLQAALKAGNDGVFVIVSDQPSVLATTSLSLDRLLAGTEIGAELRSVPGDGPIEVAAAEGVSEEMLRSLNHRRDQLRVGRAVLLVFHPSDCARVSRTADDLWKWATVVELDVRPSPVEHTAARGVVDADRYAPPLRSTDVIGPRGPLTAPPEDPSS